MYKVTNQYKDVRKFRARGKDIHVGPKQSVLTNNPPESNDVWKVEIAEEKIIKDRYKNKEETNK